ncbi:hypothetical protein [Streptomyces roseicoloratus]|uniref:hypothetical protein n=1 Tax=Streptomyces roseicoloratus TaxID=2508722 RepID=UPI001FE75BED|nr:hypothetical protein [Streptomyces roseicoloratus]
MDRRSVIRGLATAGAGAAAGAVVAGGAPAYAAGSGDDPHSVSVLSKNADPTGATPSDDAFRAAAAEVLASYQPDPISGAVPKKVLVIPPGTYRLTQPGSLLPDVDGTNPGEGHVGGIIDGVTITGYGKRLTRIIYAPAENDTTLWTNNQRYKNIRISGITFVSENPTSSFNYAYSSASHGVQDTWYSDVEWQGGWKRGIGLDGPATTSNLNSEMGWDHCQIGGSYSDAFLVLGMTPGASQQDQFLNYWFRECKVEYKAGVFVKNNRGGSMNFIGGSYILTDAASTGTFFQLSSAAGTRADSVMRLYAQGIRFELRGTGHKVIDSRWYKGSVSFVSCDDTANSFKSWAPDAVTHVYAFDANGDRGPTVRYTDCALMGSHQVATGTAATTAGKVIYDGCRFIDMTSATGASGFLRWTGTAPRYEIRDCLGGSTYVADAKNPA